MPFKIAIASGKGGTGKTSVSVNLFKQLYDLGEDVQLVDCDVEEPNDMLFFDQSEKVKGEEVCQLIPHIDNEKCTYCRKCVEYCEFNAIVVIPPVKFAEVNASLCHSCGACLVACPMDAITEQPEAIGEVNFFRADKVTGLAEGRLKIGSAMQTLLIKELKKRIPHSSNIIILDAPPGTSCPVVETISDASYVILVTEPTLFGLHDLKLMVELLHKIEKPFGVVINKAGLGSNTMYQYLNEEHIEILAEIPFSKEYAGLYASGDFLDNIPEEILNAYQDLLKALNNKIIEHEGNHYFKR